MNPEAVQKMCSYLEGNEAAQNEKYSQTWLVLNVSGTSCIYFYGNYVYFSIFFGEKYVTELSTFFSLRTSSNGRIKFGIRLTKKLMHLLHWIYDTVRCSYI